MRLILAAHVHQPLGNFDFVFERLTAESYRPFFQVLKRHPGARWAFHASGCLFEWWENHDPKMIDLIGELAGAKSLEFLLGGFYEPILAAIAHEDRLGQIKMMRDYLAKTFGVEARGLWMTERVWEPSLTVDLAEAGVRFVLLDDHHFFSSGRRAEDLFRYYLTEAEDKSVAVFPMDKTLRYLIPFKPLSEIEKYLRTLAAQGREVAVYADDGEKFGGWPGTKAWVFDEGWLENFFSALE
ncbi:MAG: 4-alpha-glucanotransferase, partial [Elusimicrobiota bacterium]